MTCCYADDALAVFESEDGARRFWRALPLRLGKFGLRLNLEKTHLLAFGKRQAWQAFRDGIRLPTFDYLGFTHDWGRSRSGKARLKRKTSKKRLRRARVDLNSWLHQERNVRTLPDLWRAVSHKMRGLCCAIILCQCPLLYFHPCPSQAFRLHRYAARRTRIA
jgi:hypothetical protein